MDDERNFRKRPYRAPNRAASAAQTREAIICAAKELFEGTGWAATTMRAIGENAGVSQKTVEAIFGTKAELLRAAVDYAIRGDTAAAPMPQRETVARMEAAPDARTMLDLHAAHLRAINERSARLAWTVEQAAPADPSVADLWQGMNHNRDYAVRWATNTLLAKPGRRHGLRQHQAAATFWTALDWGTYRTLTQHARHTPRQFEQWLRWYYHSTLLDPSA